jgi:hypothetical protein
MGGTMSRSLNRECLQKHPAKYFIETGSYTGGGASAARVMGYEKIISIEIDEDLYNTCVKLFKDDSNVRFIHGNSALELEKVLETIDEKALIFLDAHSLEYNPIMEELEAIKNCGFKDHIIMIDDKREFVRGVWTDITVSMLVKKLLEINPDYKIVYEDSNNAKGDIITAWIP